MNDSQLKGDNTSFLTIEPVLFESFPQKKFWKIELKIESITTLRKSTGSSTLTIYKNQLPQNGSCTVTPNNGTAMESNFTISCINWSDPDGIIVRYEYFGILTNILLFLNEMKM